MLFRRFTDVPAHLWRWPNFKPDERQPGSKRLALACPHCGEFYLDEPSMDALQRLRQMVGRAVYISSGHRCAIYNAMIGGAPLSAHKKIAFDIPLFNHPDRRQFLAASRAAGFGAHGCYKTFLHQDTRTGRFWYGKGGREAWQHS